MKTKKFMKSKNLAYLNERLLQITLRRIKFQNSYRIMNVDIKQELSKENDGRPCRQDHEILSMAGNHRRKQYRVKSLEPKSHEAGLEILACERDIFVHSTG